MSRIRDHQQRLMFAQPMVQRAGAARCRVSPQGGSEDEKTAELTHATDRQAYFVRLPAADAHVRRTGVGPDRARRVAAGQAVDDLRLFISPST